VIDTNVISAIWTNEPRAAKPESLLMDAYESGPIILCPIIYSELLCHPAIQPATVEELLRGAGVQIDFDLDRAIWRDAGIRHRVYAERRKRSRLTTQRRPVADFLVGAHALARADRLISFNSADFRRDFPELEILP